MFNFWVGERFSTLCPWVFSMMGHKELLDVARKPDQVKTSAQRPETAGALKQEQLEPGERIFSDQLESRLRVR